MSVPRRPIVVIVGPTAGGKTALAIALAQALPGGGECISADSMQVYRGMDIGTAKPTPAERAAVPHHLLDVADPSDEGFTVDTWLALAERAIDAVRGRGRWPVVVGGTNLYVQALLAGLADVPAPDPALRARLAGLGTDDLRAWLERVDPAAARMIHRNDRRRTIRAIEVHERTGEPLSARQGQWTTGRIRTDAVVIGLEWPVEAINRRINARVRRMMEAGLVAEVERLRGAGLGRQAREALGYRQVLEHLEGGGDLRAVEEEIRIRSRRYAKQQRTWLRRFRRYSAVTWLAADRLTPQELVNKALDATIGHAPGPGPAADSGPSTRGESAESP